MSWFSCFAAEARCNNIQLGRFVRNRTNVRHYPGTNVFKRNGRKSDLDLHPIVKPIVMVADAILGSGTTLLAAERARRRTRPALRLIRSLHAGRLTQQQARLASGQSFNDVRSERSAK